MHDIWNEKYGCSASMSTIWLSWRAIEVVVEKSHSSQLRIDTLVCSVACAEKLAAAAAQWSAEDESNSRTW